MACLDGTLNGTKVFLRVYDDTAKVWYVIAGEISNATTANNGAIDITSKVSNGFRCIMAEEGLQAYDITAELIFNDAVGFEFVRQSHLNKTIEQYQIVKLDAANPVADSYRLYITSWAETAPDNDKLTCSVSMQSSDKPSFNTEIADLSGIPEIITGSSDAGYNIKADKTHDSVIDASDTVLVPDWLVTGVGTDYEVNLNLIATDTTVGGDATDTWIDLGVDSVGDWLVTGVGFADVALQIRHKASQTLVAAKAFRIEVV